MTLRFEPTLRQAWLVDLDDGAARTQGDLCRRHAEALVLPRGWKLHDDRSERGPRAAEPSPAAPARPRRVRVPRRSGVSDAPPPTPLPGFETGDPAPNGRVVVEPIEPVHVEPVHVEPVHVEPVEVEPVEVEPEPGDIEDEPAAEEVAPVAEQPEASTGRSIPAQFGANDDDGSEEVDESLDAILDARTPLLQRAFRNTPRNT